MQETHSDGQNATEWEREFEGISILSHNTSSCHFVHEKFQSNTYDFEEIVKGRLLKVRAVFENYTFVFLCVYVPTSVIERMLFLDTLYCTLQNSSYEEFLFLAGDFNCTEHALDRNHIESHMPSRKRLTHII